jgi:lipid-binding SYLF domain-containing protein
MHWRMILIAPLVALSLLSRPAFADDPQRLVDSARVTFEEMRHDSGFNSVDVMRRAKAVLIVPELSKGGFLIGGQGGGGILMARQRGGIWGAPAFYSLGGATFGLQVGFQTAKMVLFVMTDATLQAWLRGDFRFGTQDGVAVFVQGAEHSRGKTSQGADVVAWVHANGAYAGITVEGTSVSFNRDESRAYYNKILSPEEIVFRGNAVNPGAEELRKTLGSRRN